MKLLRRWFAQFEAYHNHGRPIIQYTGMAGFFAYPLFYLLRFTKTAAPYNDLWLRVLAMVICAGLASRAFWPRKLQPYYLPFAYGALLYCLPFFFIFTSLANGGGTVAVGNTLMAVFFLILLTDWRNCLLLLVVGSSAAVAMFLLVVPNPTFPSDYVGRLPILLLVVGGGSLFKLAQNEAEQEIIKRTYSGLAGTIAHEMRTPLAQIKQHLDRMQRALPAPGGTGTVQADTLYRHLAESERVVQRGLQLIAMTLDEVNAKPMDPASFQLLSAADVVTKAVQEYSYESDGARARVAVSVVDDFTFRGDETAYLFVMFNLVRNALYYLPLHPQMKVTVIVDRHQVVVRDTGPGIAPDALGTLFEPFRSIGKSGGTGLGLAYCRRVMRAFGGDITCESVRGEYTQFTMRFVPVTQEEIETSRAAVLGKARAAIAGRRILLVEDDSAQRVTTRHKLRGVEALVDEAADGQRALELLSRQRYDLVLLDLNMPVVDGYGVAERVRAGETPLNTDVRILAYTSEPAHLASVKTRNAGMDGFVAKPCAQLALVLAIQQALQKPARAHAGTPLSGRRVLLADDSPFNRKAVAAYLRSAGAAVVEADHGASVLEHLRAHENIDVVLMDINMPGMGGLEAAQAIRSSGERWASVPIVALTAHSEQAALDAARGAGMDGFLVKPVDATLLYETLKPVLIAGDRHARTVATPAPAPAPAEGELLNRARLESYRRLGMLDELLDDYLPEITRLVETLEPAAARRDHEATLAALHSLLGMSGEAGGLALYQLVRRLYIPMVEDQSWPKDPGWVQQVRALAERTGQALKDYGATREAPAA